MATYIMTWNPSRWHWDDNAFETAVRRTESGQLASEKWSCGNTRRILAGDRVFLLRQSSERGMVGAGFASTDTFLDTHWDEERVGEQVPYVDCQWEVILRPSDRLPTEDLVAADIGVPWNNLMASGVQVPEEAAAKLEELWERHLARVGRRRGVSFVLPEEVSSPGRYREGAVQSVTVNSYERNPRARAACIEHWGFHCTVCDFNFVEAYGEMGREYIHVHHLKDLATIGEEYEVDPVEDLRPVCPNCHAMLHRTVPAMDIEDLRSIVCRRQGGERS